MPHNEPGTHLVHSAIVGGICAAGSVVFFQNVGQKVEIYCVIHGVAHILFVEILSLPDDRVAISSKAQLQYEHLTRLGEKDRSLGSDHAHASALLIGLHHDLHDPLNSSFRQVIVRFEVVGGPATTTHGCVSQS